jgi:hypothetical protein
VSEMWWNVWSRMGPNDLSTVHNAPDGSGQENRN